jgi:hypothetical protein
MHSIALFPISTDLPKDRFAAFIDWAKPFGTAGINHIHAQNFIASAPYFDWSHRFFSHGDQGTRSWLLKHEYRHAGRLVFARTRRDIAPKIYDRDGLIEEGVFLDFAKAYLNVMAHYRNLRSPAKAMVSALTFLEKSLRDLNSNDNNPTYLNCRVFEHAINAVEQADLCHGKKYDIGKEIEIAAGMLQGGYHSKTFRFSDKGFRLLARPFSFTSRIQPQSRLRTRTLNSFDLRSQVLPRITSEEVAAVGVAYRKSVARYGIDDTATFMASIAGLALTTVSMRVSDLLTLRRDCIYKSNNATQRHRIRLNRPKTGVSQDLPLTKKLGELAETLFNNILTYSTDAHHALEHYVKNFGESFDSINELYIPENLRPIFSKANLTIPEVYEVMQIPQCSSHATSLPRTLQAAGLDSFWFVDEPNDIWHFNEGRGEAH